MVVSFLGVSTVEWTPLLMGEWSALGVRGPDGVERGIDVSN